VRSAPLMAHLQPSAFPDGRSTQKVRLTSLRGFTANTVRLTGRQVKEAWAARFCAQGGGHAYWLYTHIPFCPQICSFCQCSTSLRKSDRQVAAYLEWLEGELDFLAPVATSGVARFQYVGGGTPNILSEPQLERLLGTINRHCRFDSGSRRTFEFLPSGLRPETLPLVRSFGFNRLSCGVQSWSPETLKAVNRSRSGLDELGRIIEAAYAVGYDEFNVDLIHGIGAETREQFLDGLLEVLALRPTTVTIHHVIPTATNPVFSSVAEELAAHAVFEQLEHSLGEDVTRRFPHMEWVLRPNSWIVADRRFRRGPAFSLWYYSDNERIHIDMLSFGRFAHSNLLGTLMYENLSTAERYDPDEPSYQTFRKTPTLDAALDLVTDLVGDRRSDLAPISQRYGPQALAPLQPALAQLEAEGHLIRTRGSWETVHTDGVFVDPFLPILEAALQGAPGPWSVAMGKGAAQGIQIGEGDRSLMVFIEKITPGKQYYMQIGRFGVYYRNLRERQVAAQAPRVAEDLMREFISEMRQLVDQSPNLSIKEATAALRDTFQRRTV